MTNAIEDMTQANRRGIRQYVIEVGDPKTRKEIPICGAYNYVSILARGYANAGKTVILRYQDDSDIEEVPAL